MTALLNKWGLKGLRMNDTNLSDAELLRLDNYKSNQKWIHAFNWWYHSANRDRIHSNLHEGVFLTPKNSKFLACILDGMIKPLTARQNGLARFKSSIIDNKIIDLQSRGFSREAILDDLKRTGLIPKNILLDGLDKRLYRAKKSPVVTMAELDQKFADLYERITKL